MKKGKGYTVKALEAWKQGIGYYPPPGSFSLKTTGEFLLSDDRVIGCKLDNGTLVVAGNYSFVTDDMVIIPRPEIRIHPHETTLFLAYAYSMLANPTDQIHERIINIGGALYDNDDEIYYYLLNEDRAEMVIKSKGKIIPGFDVLGEAIRGITKWFDEQRVPYTLEKSGKHVVVIMPNGQKLVMGVDNVDA